MATPTFFSNWPTFHHTAAVPPPPDLPPFHDNFTFSDNNTLVFHSNHQSSSFNNNHLHFHNPPNYPTLTSTYNNPPITTRQQLFAHDYYSNPIASDFCDFGEFIPMNPVDPMQPEWYSYPSYPMVPDVCCMEDVQLPMPEIYDGGGSSGVMPPTYGGGVEFNADQSSHVQNMKETGNGGGRLSAQSMAARVRRRKISEKTLELGKLVPGGHRLTTAEMFQAAFKYIKFLQAQVDVLQLMPSSPGLGSELQALLTSPSIQEKLYAAGKCIVSQTLGETLADDHQRTNNQMT